MYKYICNWW